MRNWRRIDGHVHLVGDGSDGSECWFSFGARWNRLLAEFMIREVGLPRSAIERDLDRLYRERLLSLVRSSTLDAVLLLAQEVPRDDRGRELNGEGTFFVPNDYVLRLAREHPEFIPTVYIHPARPDAMDELECCLAEGSPVMKYLPNY